MKSCKKCNVELVVGENWYSSMAKIGDYKCKKCKNQLTNSWQLQNPKKRKLYDKNYRDKNGSERTKMWVQNNLEQHKQNLEKKHNSINPGVYAVYYRWLLLYIGESQKPYRRISQHLSKPYVKGGKGKTISSSKVVELMVDRNLKYKHLSYKILEFENDYNSRLELEDKYRCELKPYINPL